MGRSKGKLYGGVKLNERKEVVKSGSFLVGEGKGPSRLYS